MTHPLTDEQLEALEIARIEHPLNDLRIYDEIISLELPRPNDDVRAAYDKGIQACIDWLLNYPWRGRTVQGIAEDMEEELLAHKGMLQSDQPNKED